MSFVKGFCLMLIGLTCGALAQSVFSTRFENFNNHSQNRYFADEAALDDKLKLFELYKHFEKNKSIGELSKKVIFTNSNGDIVGILYPGCTISSAGIDDFDDTDLSMWRMKVVFDVNKDIPVEANNKNRRIIRAELLNESESSNTTDSTQKQREPPGF